MSSRQLPHQQIGFRLAVLGFFSFLMVFSVAQAEEFERSGQDALSEFFDTHGIPSDAGWTAAAVEQEENRYVLLRDSETGDIYQLGDLDDVYVKDLGWTQDDVLQVSGVQTDGMPFDTRIQLHRRADSAEFEFLSYELDEGRGLSGGARDMPRTGPSMRPAGPSRPLQVVNPGNWGRGR
jgi:hypothetical protein